MKKSIVFTILGIVIFYAGHSVIRVTQASGAPHMVEMMALIGGLFRGVGVAFFLAGILLLMRYKRKK